MRKLHSALLAMAYLAACTTTSPTYLVPVESYLVENIGHAFSVGKVFCAYDVLGIAPQNDGMNVYVWALCGEYFLNNDILTLGTASSLPVALYEKKTDGKFTLTGHESPGDGTAYGPDIQRIFPPDAIQAMSQANTDYYNERATRLENEVEQKAREYYGLK